MRVDEVSRVRQEVEIILLWQELASGTVVTTCTKRQKVRNYSKDHAVYGPAPKVVSNYDLFR